MRAAGGLVDGDAPEIHRAAAAAREGDEPAVGRPCRAPVDRRVVGDRDRIACLRSIGGDGEDVALELRAVTAPARGRVDAAGTSHSRPRGANFSRHHRNGARRAHPQPTAMFPHFLDNGISARQGFGSISSSGVQMIGGTSPAAPNPLFNLPTQGSVETPNA